MPYEQCGAEVMELPTQEVGKEPTEPMPEPFDPFVARVGEIGKVTLGTNGITCDGTPSLGIRGQ